MTDETFRIEKDVLGELKVRDDKYWGVNTQRAIDNFKISGRTFPSSFIVVLAQVKKACAITNMELGLLKKDIGASILLAIDELVNENKYMDQFPIDIFQTGSGTQTNMNMNEVLANRANELLGYPKGKKHPVHPNDHVNLGQSSNDVIPTAMHVSVLHSIHTSIIPSLESLITSLSRKIVEFKDFVKVGRTHLQDAVPIPVALEFEVYRSQIIADLKLIQDVSKDLLKLPVGGTVLGTGINAHASMPSLTCKHLAEITGFPFTPNPVSAEGIASHRAMVNMSSSLRVLALSLLKLANDIRWMGSGPRSGLGELLLPENEPGSSIMPGKINPTQSEALIQVCLQVLGNDMTISLGEGYGSILDLNTCKPLIIVTLLYSLEILASGITSFIAHCLDGLKVNEDRLKYDLDQMLMVVTNLVPLIGYDRAAELARTAYNSGKAIKQVITERNIHINGDLDSLLDPRKMISPDR